MTEKEATDSATGLLQLVEVFAVGRFGADGAFTTEEKFLIEGPLSRLIERYGSLANQYSGLIDPVMLLIGAGIYGARIVAILRQKVADKATVAPPGVKNDNPASFSDNGSQPINIDPFALVGSVHNQS